MDDGMGENDVDGPGRLFETVRLDRASVRDGPIWECKIGLKPGTKVVLPGGCDSPIRAVVSAEFERITGHSADFLFSGWGAELNDGEKAVIDDEEPDGWPDPEWPDRDQ